MKKSPIVRYMIELWRAIDQFVNAILGGYARESVSSRLGRTNPDCWFCRTLSRLIERDHCRRVASSEAAVVSVLESMP